MHATMQTYSISLASVIREKYQLLSIGLYSLLTISKETDRQTDRDRDRDRDRLRPTETETDRQTETQTDRQTDTDRDRDRQIYLFND